MKQFQVSFWASKFASDFCLQPQNNLQRQSGMEDEEELRQAEEEDEEIEEDEESEEETGLELHTSRQSYAAQYAQIRRRKWKPGWRPPPPHPSLLQTFY